MFHPKVFYSLRQPLKLVDNYLKRPESSSSELDYLASIAKLPLDIDLKENVHVDADQGISSPQY